MRAPLWSSLAQNELDDGRDGHRGAVDSVTAQKVASHSGRGLALKVRPGRIRAVAEKEVGQTACQSVGAHLLERSHRRSLCWLNSGEVCCRRRLMCSVFVVRSISRVTVCGQRKWASQAYAKQGTGRVGQNRTEAKRIPRSGDKANRNTITEVGKDETSHLHSRGACWTAQPSKALRNVGRLLGAPLACPTVEGFVDG